MRTATISRRTLAVALATIGAAVPSTALLLPGAAVARPIGDFGGPKNCSLGGSRINSGSRGRAGGVEYECTDGVACQVEGGRTTRKCSHAARYEVLRRPHGNGVLVVLAR
jgi:hypothetical protein